MDNSGITLFINACLLLIGLVILQMVLKAWDKRAKAKDGEVQKPVAKKKK
jgi:hypothetical protein